MRFIDGDALLAEYDRVHVGKPGGARKLIEDAPTIEPERKRGWWLTIERGEDGYSAGDFRCSVCGKPNKCYTLTDYCPNCGAETRGDST